MFVVDVGLWQQAGGCRQLNMLCLVVDRLVGPELLLNMFPLAHIVGCWLLAAGSWLLAGGCGQCCWLLAVGFWLLAVEELVGPELRFNICFAFSFANFVVVWVWDVNAWFCVCVAYVVVGGCRQLNMLLVAVECLVGPELLLNMLAVGCWLQAAGCWLVAGGWCLVAGGWLLWAAGCWLLAGGCWLLAAG